MLTGRYQFKLGHFGRVVLWVEEAYSFKWRPATEADLEALEPAVADGWRFPEERNGFLGPDGMRREGFGLVAHTAATRPKPVLVPAKEGN